MIQFQQALLQPGYFSKLGFKDKLYILSYKKSLVLLETKLHTDLHMQGSQAYCKSVLG